MLAYATIGSNDLPRVAGFHDEVLGIIGGKCSIEFGQFIAWGTGEDAASLAVTKPFDGNAATVGNGCTVSLQADSRETVNVSSEGTRLGGSDEGAPGQRMECGVFPRPGWQQALRLLHGRLIAPPRTRRARRALSASGSAAAVPARTAPRRWR